MQRIYEMAILGGLAVALIALLIGAPMVEKRRDVPCVKLAESMPLFGVCR